MRSARWSRGNLEIRRLPLAEEAGAPGAYGGAGSIDGIDPRQDLAQPGRRTDRHSRFGVADLAFHEGIPGHVWQGEYANQLPLIRSLLAFNAYSEGWALYAETLGDELGAYEGDPVGQLGYLQSICVPRLPAGGRHRAPRQALEPRAGGRVVRRRPTVRAWPKLRREVDRYCSWPGQACGYKMGHSEILRQRARAQAALGRATICAISTRRWSMAATCRSTCWRSMWTATSRVG